MGDNHEDTAIAYGNLAANFASQGRHAEAQPVLEKALAIRSSLATDADLTTATLCSNLAWTLVAQGKFREAEQFCERALAIRRRLLADGHPLIGNSFGHLAETRSFEGRLAEAQTLFEQALEIHRSSLGDDHPDTAATSSKLGANLLAQGRYAQAELFCERGANVTRRLLSYSHPQTARSLDKLAATLNAQGKYEQAEDQWLESMKGLNLARLRAAFCGLERAGASASAEPSLAALQARLGKPAQAWQALEQNLGRGLLDELAARGDHRLTAAERLRLRELTSELERLDKLAEVMPAGLDRDERRKHFEQLKRDRELASIALGEFQTKLVQEYGPLGGRVAGLGEVQAALPADVALVAWVDISPAGPNAADPDGEHWGVVVRSRGVPVWVPIKGTGARGSWTEEDTGLAERVRKEMANKPGSGAAGVQTLLDRMRRSGSSRWPGLWAPARTVKP